MRDPNFASTPRPSLSSPGQQPINPRHERPHSRAPHAEYCLKEDGHEGRAKLYFQLSITSCIIISCRPQGLPTRPPRRVRSRRAAAFAPCQSRNIGQLGQAAHVAGNLAGREQRAIHYRPWGVLTVLGLPSGHGNLGFGVLRGTVHSDRAVDAGISGPARLVRVAHIHLLLQSPLARAARPML